MPPSPRFISTRPHSLSNPSLINPPLLFSLLSPQISEIPSRVLFSQNPSQLTSQNPIFPPQSLTLIRISLLMGAYTVASPLCTCPMAACMSVTCDGDRPLRSPSVALPSTSRFSKWGKRRRSSVQDSPRGLVSALYGPGVNSLMSTCLPFEPREEFYRSLRAAADRSQKRAAYCGKNINKKFNHFSC